MFAQRMQHIETSGIRKMFEMAAKMKDPINLSLGQPDFDVPENVKEAAIKAIRDGHNGYTVTGGILELREAILNSLAREDIRPQAVMAVAGASAGLTLALLALADEHTEVLIPDPCFVSYVHMVKLTNAKIRWINTAPDFRLTPERLLSAIQESQKISGLRNRILLFNTPVNPTGIAYTEDEIKNLSSLTKEHQIQVLSDEVYDQFCYDFKHTSWLKYDENAVLIRTMGKNWGMTGWRSGYVAGPQSIINHITTLQQFTYVCVNTPSQWASIEALKTDISHHIAAYKIKRDKVFHTLKDCYTLNQPQGAFYAYVKYPADADTFVKKCIENEILIVPGSAFSQQNTHFRISFALDDERLEKGLQILIRLAS